MAPHSGSDPTDLQLVDSVLRGRSEAFHGLYERHQPWLLRYLTAQSGDRNLAEDLVQETFLLAFRHMPVFGDGRPFAPWLYRVAQNRLRRVWHRRRLRRAVSLEWAFEGARALPPVLQNGGGIDATAEGDLVRRVLDDLSPPLREALLLNSLVGFHASEVADIAGISPAAAERRISRAKARFRERYNALLEDAQGGRTPGTGVALTTSRPRGED